MPSRAVEVKGILFSLDQFQKTWRGFDKRKIGFDEAKQEDIYEDYWYVAVMFLHGQDVSIPAETEEDREELLKMVNAEIKKALNE